jgi:8-oxo-dGTP pyrophosphatase MutT (NUDIX family)
MSDAGPVYAAGAVLWRLIDGKMHVLLIHRTVHGDITIPKGKVDPGETLPVTAVREIREETGLSIALGVPLGVSEYPMPGGKTKIVHYWAAEVLPEHIARSTFVPNGEVAALEWVTIKKARGYLSYGADVQILEAFAALVAQGITRTFAIIALRHAKATAPHDWSGSDATRPLSERGVAQAAALVPTVRAWRPERIFTSTATRCAVVGSHRRAVQAHRSDQSGRLGGRYGGCAARRRQAGQGPQDRRVVQPRPCAARHPAGDRPGDGIAGHLTGRHRRGTGTQRVLCRAPLRRQSQRGHPRDREPPAAQLTPLGGFEWTGVVYLPFTRRRECR